MNKPKILFYDIETAPALGYAWGKWKQNIIDFERGFYMLSWSAKWKDGKHITKGLIDYKGYKKDKENDKKLVEELHRLLSEADILVHQNGDRFDIKKCNSRFIIHGMKPPTPVKTVDTVKVARKYFGFESNKLDDLGKFLGVGRKTRHEGIDLWFDCMAGDSKSWGRMKRYNQNDVILLEKVYNKMLPFITNHPPYGIFVNSGEVCPNCGSKELQSRGYAVNKTSKYRRFQCQSCGVWGRSTKNIQEVKPLVGI